MRSTPTVSAAAAISSTRGSSSSKNACIEHGVDSDAARAPRRSSSQVEAAGKRKDNLHCVGSRLQRPVRATSTGAAHTAARTDQTWRAILLTRSSRVMRRQSRARAPDQALRLRQSSEQVPHLRRRRECPPLFDVWVTPVRLHRSLLDPPVGVGRVVVRTTGRFRTKPCPSGRRPCLHRRRLRSSGRRGGSGRSQEYSDGRRSCRSRTLPSRSGSRAPCERLNTAHREAHRGAAHRRQIVVSSVSRK